MIKVKRTYFLQFGTTLRVGPMVTLPSYLRSCKMVRILMLPASTSSPNLETVPDEPGPHLDTVPYDPHPVGLSENMV